MKPPVENGFSLIELMIVVIIFGMIVAFSIPAFSTYSASHQLKAATEDIAGQLRLAREKAIGTGATQTMHFSAGYLGSDYHVHNGSVVDPKWKLPNNIAYYWGSGTQWEYRMTKDGRCMDSGMIILQDPKGRRDTVSVQMSGLILD